MVQGRRPSELSSLLATGSRAARCSCWPILHSCHVSVLTPVLRWQNFLLDQLNRPAGECLIPEPARSNTIATIRYGFTHTFHKASDAWDGVAHEYSVFLQHCSERHRFIGLKLPNDLLERLNPFLQLYLLYEILYLKFAPLSPSPDYSMLPSMERAAEKIEAAARQVDVPPEIRGDLVSFASGPGHQLHVMMNLSDDDDP